MEVMRGKTKGGRKQGECNGEAKRRRTTGSSGSRKVCTVEDLQGCDGDTRHTEESSRASLPGSSRRDPTVQVFVKNLTGQSVSIHVDLHDDVHGLEDAVAEREGLPGAWLRFVFAGRQLEPGQPLHRYGISKGSNIHLTSVLRSARPWVELSLDIVTPFAEASGVLRVHPEKGRRQIALSPSALGKISQSSPYAGEGKYEDAVWVIRLGDYHPFPCIRQPGIDDIWKRLGRTQARMVLRSRCADGSWTVHAVLISVGDELPMHLPDDKMDGSHMIVSLLTDEEQAIEDVTERFREIAVPGMEEDICCICLDPMLSGQVVRRLPCLHRLHAGCAMVLDGLPRTQSCPLCRCSIFAAAGQQVIIEEEYEAEDVDLMPPYAELPDDVDADDSDGSEDLYLV